MLSKISQLIQIPFHISKYTGNNFVEDIGHNPNKEYDAILYGVSQNPSEIAEAINHLYFGKYNSLHDESGKIKELYNRLILENNEKTRELILKNIGVEMVKQAEIVPLYYYGICVLYNNKHLNFSRFPPLSDYPALWKLEVEN